MATRQLAIYAIDNSAIGAGALYNNTTGGDNTAVRAGAGANNPLGNNDTFIGYFAKATDGASYPFTAPSAKVRNPP